VHFPSLEQIIYTMPAFVLAISFHEFAHAWVADKLGDSTARRHGRLTLDPRSHFDLFGFFLFIFAGFGWAKGVPFNSANFEGNKRVATIAVSLAGVIANFIIAFLALLLIRCLGYVGIFSSSEDIGVTVLTYIAVYNVMFMVFNLLPIPPLDGSKVLAALVPWEFEERLYSLDRYGFFILIILIYTGWTDTVLVPLMSKSLMGITNMVDYIFAGGL